MAPCIADIAGDQVERGWDVAVAMIAALVVFGDAVLASTATMSMSDAGPVFHGRDDPLTWAFCHECVKDAR